MIGRIGQRIISTVLAIGLILLLFAPFYQSLIIKEKKTGFPVGWSDHINLSNSSMGDSKCSFSLSGNDLHVVWRHTYVSGSDYQIVHTKSNDGGRTWNQFVNVSNSPLMADNPDVDLFNNNIHTVWNEVSIGEIYYGNSTDSGGTWGTPKMISSNDGFNSEGAKIAVNNSNLHVIWVDERNGFPNTEIYYNRSLDGGITWEGEIRLTNAPFSSAPVGISANGSNIHVTFVDDRTGSFGLYYIRSRDNGVTWDDGQDNFGDARLISTNEVLQGAMTINGSNIHAVWVNEQAGPACRLYYRNSTNNGLSWSTPTLLTGPNNGSYAPDIGVDGDEAWVFWNDNRDDDSTPELYFKNSTDGGINWGDDTRLTEVDGYISGAPKIAISNSKKHVVWVDQRDGNPEIYYKRYPDFPTDTTPPEISPTPVTSANVFDTINITANITDDVSVNAVYLNYTGVYQCCIQFFHGIPYLLLNDYLCQTQLTERAESRPYLPGNDKGCSQGGGIYHFRGKKGIPRKCQ
ncbi:MAG: exo-alpha-sialidase [Bacteroidales bacterium]